MCAVNLKENTLRNLALFPPYRLLACSRASLGKSIKIKIEKSKLDNHLRLSFSWCMVRE